MTDKLVLKRDRIVAPEYFDGSYLQNVFFQGNGEIGLRGVLPGDSLNAENHGMFKAGVFDYIKGGITDMVNLPDPIVPRIRVDGRTLCSPEQMELFRQELLFESALLRRRMVFEGVELEVERLVSLKDPDVVAMRVRATGPAEVDFEFGTDVMNMPVNDDQSIDDHEFIALTGNYRCDGDRMEFSTRSGDFNFRYTRKVTVSGGCSECLVTLGDELPSSFDEVLSGNLDYLASFWRDNDIVIDGPEEDQCALRFNILAVLENSPRRDVSIGARGLAHPRYKGCYFWDTEVFILPYLMYTRPEAAKHVLEYRYKTLDAARRNAALHNLEGARYPWMCSLDGSEQCESWDTGKCEIHVTADIAWAFDRYLKVTGDQGMARKAAEIYLETARYWRSRFLHDPRSDRYNMLFVKGPDEYCGVTTNNTYTNLMAVNNIRLALESARRGLVDITEEERAAFEDIVGKVSVPYSSEYGTYLEDDLFPMLEPLDLGQSKADGAPLYRTLCFDRLQRYRVLKQPDVLLLLVLLPELFSREQAVNAWNLYEPITCHDSTLSWGMHSLAAYRLGLNDRAEDYLRRTLHLDLRNLMDNTQKEGLHIGAMGTALQAILFGAAALESGEPVLPSGWRSLRTSVFLNGERHSIHIEKEANKSVKDFVDKS